MAAIFYASSIPDLSALPGGVSDKVGHFIGYAILGALLLRAVAGARVAGATARVAWITLAVSVSYGASDEGHQYFVHGRTPALDDLAADALGAAVAIAVCWLLTAAVRAHRARSGEV
jgi:VanZ family protein